MTFPFLAMPRMQSKLCRRLLVCSCIDNSEMGLSASPLGAWLLSEAARRMCVGRIGGASSPSSAVLSEADEAALDRRKFRLSRD